MDEIEVAKLGDIIGLLKEYGVAAFKFKDLEIVMVPEAQEALSTDAIGFAAEPEREDPDDEESRRKAPAGYKALFGKGFPKFPKGGVDP